MANIPYFLYNIEDGWQRIDDYDDKIYYIGNGWRNVRYQSNPDLYMNTCHYTYDTDIRIL